VCGGPPCWGTAPKAAGAAGGAGPPALRQARAPLARRALAAAGAGGQGQGQVQLVWQRGRRERAGYAGLAIGPAGTDAATRGGAARMARRDRPGAGHGRAAARGCAPPSAPRGALHLSGLNGYVVAADVVGRGAALHSRHTKQRAQTLGKSRGRWRPRRGVPSLLRVVVGGARRGGRARVGFSVFGFSVHAARHERSGFPVWRPGAMEAAGGLSLSLSPRRVTAAPRALRRRASRPSSCRRRRPPRRAAPRSRRSRP
jgi:hypothetical protein